jgi:tetraacyldisaccharide 4'-kinase
VKRTKRLKIKGIYFFYRFLQALASPAVVFYFLFRGVRNSAYLRTVKERLGCLPHSYRQTTAGAVWLHAVSVGEVLATLELARRIRAELPNSPLFVSTSTIAGYATAREKLAGIAAGVFHAPLDYAFAVRRVLRTVRPSVIIVAETEIWPNLFREARRSGAGVLIVNGRISDRALPRYVKFRRFFGPVLAQANAILVQSEAMRDRFLAAGAAPEAIQVAGNLKYDFEARSPQPGSPVAALLDRIRPARVWIAASTMPPAADGDVDEDDAVILAFRELAARHPGLLLILAPRKPERFDTAARKLEQASIPHLRRSQMRGNETLTLPGVLLLDTIGELSGLFALADAVFMGGTLPARGGHNILEPAFFGRPVVVGPHMENFADIAADFAAAGACVQIQSAEELAPALDGLLGSPERAAEIGRRALACAEARRGATARSINEIRRLFAESFPCPVRPLVPRLALGALAKVWETGGKLKRKRDLARQHSLRAPVISVGNITMGGTGKTPAVLLLAEKLQDRRPGILTRGYGRKTPQKYAILAPNARISVQISGDEPQMFLRSGVAPVGIGPDRFESGRMLEDRFHTGVLILDDGFQHLRLARQVDIVLVDALQPFGGCAVFPLGRLREPLEQLRRADVFLVTRSRFGRTLEAIEQRLHSFNPEAPIFRAVVEPQEWVDCATGEALPLDAFQSVRVGAFCGLGNPGSFWSTLEGLGLDPLDRLEFSDHHTYRPHELRRMADQFSRGGAKAMLTTEKDMLNLCDRCEDLVAPLHAYWLRVRMSIEREEEFLRFVEGRLDAFVPR